MTSTSTSLKLSALSLATAVLVRLRRQRRHVGRGRHAAASSALAVEQSASALRVSVSGSDRWRHSRRRDRAGADAVRLLGQRHRRHARGHDDQRDADPQDRTGRRRDPEVEGPADAEHLRCSRPARRRAIAAQVAALREQLQSAPRCAAHRLPCRRGSDAANPARCAGGRWAQRPQDADGRAAARRCTPSRPTSRRARRATRTTWPS